ncbi:hypothetical protein LKI_06650 [Leuconostoc kimchii IMSNU 11154]|uniref:Uncharacterized protein n=1 Tax=Leuconostoc kimchii (strain IMSNU 11154 / KCTC 2386 / IH25) TaxID=762051 RepID=D5T3M0_LEUKI|nr:hypothetical protein LKI_06650 [Leuconostoc kimchii IMSNU 11154]
MAMLLNWSSWNLLINYYYIVFKKTVALKNATVFLNTITHYELIAVG